VVDDAATAGGTGHLHMDRMTSSDNPLLRGKFRNFHRASIRSVKVAPLAHLPLESKRVPVSDRDETQTQPPNDLATRLNAAWPRIEMTLVAVLRRRLKSRNEVREVIHDTYLQLMGCADSKVIRNLESFAVTVAKNLLAKGLRDRSCHQRLNDQFVINQELQFGTEELRSPEQINVERQELDMVMRKFDRLADDRKRVFAARFDDEPVKSVASRFDKTPDAVYQIVKRVRDDLGEEIERPRGEPADE
jgi:RNA polymerase sigma factor (sigma-70 family)